MKATGGCYCGEIRFELEVPDDAFRGQCHCYECTRNSGGSPNVFLMAPDAGFSYTKGRPRSFTRSDLEKPVTREFCGSCGAPILTRNEHLFPGAVILKAGALDDESVYGMPAVAIHMLDRKSYHMVPDGTATFDRLPGG